MTGFRGISPVIRRGGVPFLVLAAVLLVAAGGCAPKRVGAPDPGRPAAESVRKVAPGHAPPSASRPSAESRGHEIRPSEANPPAVPLGQEAANLARRQLGKPYQWGAAGPDRFDCSGLAYYVYGRLGVGLPRVSSDQARAGRAVPESDLRPGDLLFFAVDSSRINHVGIYLGHRRFVHAPRRYQPVRTDTLDDAYWRNRLKVARRMSRPR